MLHAAIWTVGSWAGLRLPGFPRYTWADLNRLNDATSDPSTLVHSHHTGIPAFEWIT
jgi:hypothetical protein